MDNLPTMLDLNASQDNISHVEITIRKDGKVVWINADGFCVFRVCQLNGQVIIHDERTAQNAGQYG